jgi:hypothetical protein
MCYIRVEEAQMLVALPAALETIQPIPIKPSSSDDIPFLESKWDQDQFRLGRFRRASRRGGGFAWRV